MFTVIHTYDHDHYCVKLVEYDETLATVTS